MEKMLKPTYEFFWPFKIDPIIVTTSNLHQYYITFLKDPFEHLDLKI
jgi:hypothetical protein